MSSPRRAPVGYLLVPTRIYAWFLSSLQDIPHKYIGLLLNLFGLLIIHAAACVTPCCRWSVNICKSLPVSKTLLDIKNNQRKRHVQLQQSTSSSSSEVEHCKAVHCTR